MNRIVLDASAGVELLLNTVRARSLSAQFPAEAEWWVPEHYFAEVAVALRRAGDLGNASPSQVGRAFAMLERAVLRRVQVRALLAEAWKRRASLTVADEIGRCALEHGAGLQKVDRDLYRLVDHKIEP